MEPTARRSKPRQATEELNVQSDPATPEVFSSNGSSLPHKQVSQQQSSRREERKGAEQRESGTIAPSVSSEDGAGGEVDIVGRGRAELATFGWAEQVLF